MIIDAHQHFWDLRLFRQDWLKAPAHRPIRRSFLPRHLAPLLRRAAVDRTIFVQTKHDLAETRWALEQTAKHPWIAGIVGWVDLASPRCEAQLEEFLDHPRFVGVRHVVQDEPDDRFILRPSVQRGLAVLEKRGVPYDLLFYVRHLPHAADVARRRPGLTLVLDHLSKPRVKEGRVLGWIDELRDAARRPNVVAKLSGLVTEADWRGWSASDLRPYVQAAIELFGPDRLMFGSDWPVCLLAARYGEWLDVLRELISPLSTSEQAKILGGTAARVYRLKGSRR